MAREPKFLPRDDEHLFAQYVRILGKGKTGSRNFDSAEAEAAMDMVLAGDVEDTQLGAFLMLLRVKEESAEELAGFVRAARKHINAPLNRIAVDLDWSSYAGKRYQLPWYLLAALALADSGSRVFMHGSAGHTAGRIYSEGVLSELGIAAAENWDDVDAQINASGFSFMPLRVLCPELQDIINLRNVLGLRSPVHTLSRLLNPLAADHSLQSVFHPAYSDTHQQAAVLLGETGTAVFKGEAGEVERKPDADTLVKFTRQGLREEQQWPRIQAQRQPRLESLPIDTLLRVWRGDIQDDYGELAVISTMAISLVLMGKADGRDDAHTLARELWSQRNLQRL